ncbi:hypothetical protein GCM10007301_26300 [Azorhizobium oxalatiphilum]|uniref:DUF945 domain-containing protein n=1 Tax=Azorhizobium oxalatiphilum TaxID=980631 RepID=A0A917FCM5_9HYPH|nr:hypothetical protein [Azorhizobium oxalatiphilum]GGF65265.1 hypothetical protein GCM10007301_26300 [Azorhizobium oxalatiphilum]
MKKVAIGVVVLAVLGIGGYFGFNYYVQYRAKSDVEALFATLRQQGATATYKDVGFTLAGRVLTVKGIDITSGGNAIKADQFTAQGVTSPSGGTVQAGAIEFSGLSVTATGIVGTDTVLTYSMPQVRIENYQGPDRLQPVPAGNGSQPAMREALVRFAGIRADSFTVPQFTAHLEAKAGTPADKAVQPMDVTYSGLKASGIAEGRVAEIAIDKVAYTTKVKDGDKTNTLNGEMVNLRSSGVDTGPIRALTDATPPTTGPQPVYARITTGAYTLKQENGTLSNFGSMSLERIAVDPAKLSFARLDELTALAQKGVDHDPQQSAKLLAVMADMLNGIAIGDITVKDVSLTEKNDASKIESMSLKGFSNGRLDVMELNGVTGSTSDKKPVVFKRLALLGLSMGDLLQTSAATLLQGDKPDVATSLGMFKAMAGFEIEGLVAPHEETGGQIKIEKTSVTWGDFVGLVPSRVSIKLDKITGPISAEDGEPFSYLAATGMKEGTISAQLDMRYADGTLTFAPFAFELEKAFATRIAASVTELPKSALEKPETLQETFLSSKIGPISVAVTNLGIGELMLKQQAELMGVAPEELRTEVIATITETTDEIANAMPDAKAVGEAVAAFVKAPGTLTITLTPNKPMTWVDLMGGFLGSDDPVEALSAFTIKASAAP